MRRLVAEHRLHPADLVLPVFVRDGISEPQPVGSMPGVVQHTLDSLVAAAREAVEAGIGLTWHRYIGGTGRIVSLEHFGASADYKVLFREFGLTSAAVAAAARDSIAAAR